MEYVILEEYRKGGGQTWGKKFPDFESAEKAIVEKVGEKYIEYYERWANSWCGTDVSYSIVEIN